MAIGRAGVSRREAGFTLIELMIVIAIISIIASIAIPNLLSAKAAANETSAIATLRTMGSAQMMVQSGAKIDTDNDAQGEFGTLMEMAGLTKVRRGRVLTVPLGSDFSATANSVLNPSALPAALGQVDKVGFCTKAGYALMVLLPDTSTPLAKWAHEVNNGTYEVPAPDFSNAGQNGGGTAKVWVDLSESLWCAYAIPVALGNSGTRCFFVSQDGTILQSPNDVAKHQGVTVAIDGRSAFLGDWITSKPAVGTAGKDLDVWRNTN